jgi:hypothetical protein
LAQLGWLLLLLLLVVAKWRDNNTGRHSAWFMEL